jgi:hypothetical protein
MHITFDYVEETLRFIDTVSDIDRTFQVTRDEMTTLLDRLNRIEKLGRIVYDVFTKDDWRIEVDVIYVGEYARMESFRLYQYDEQLDGYVYKVGRFFDDTHSVVSYSVIHEREYNVSRREFEHAKQVYRENVSSKDANGFYGALTSTIRRADLNNLRKLAQVFPAMVAAHVEYAYGEDDSEFKQFKIRIEPKAEE